MLAECPVSPKANKAGKATAGRNRALLRAGWTIGALRSSRPLDLGACRGSQGSLKWHKTTRRPPVAFAAGAVGNFFFDSCQAHYRDAPRSRNAASHRNGCQLTKVARVNLSSPNALLGFLNSCDDGGWVNIAV